ncbi:hypothetical protein PVAP13_6NG121403 [Panicum virgatum]|uniref:Uncharacterized protein n=1 Tax=Panicum virgatum TaxID=38727 RepID=A0A8T0QZW4_PANVG|nr:hypothetical protein PVAP13_6NG121403 [Panicum virgatum]
MLCVFKGHSKYFGCNEPAAVGGRCSARVRWDAEAANRKRTRYDLRTKTKTTGTKTVRTIRHKARERSGLLGPWFLGPNREHAKEKYFKTFRSAG